MKHTQDVDALAKIIWDYMRLNQNPQKADVIIGLGSHDLGVAEYCAKLYLEGFAPLILFTGNEGAGKDISGFDGEPEAIAFKKEAMKLGVEEGDILVETAATNTGENIVKSAELLRSQELKLAKVMVVSKPYMDRRVFATLMAQWPKPQPEFSVVSQPVDYSEYMNSKDHLKDANINIMVGDLKRIKEYPKLGFQIEQDIPSEVWDAYLTLTHMGYGVRCN